ncbi:MAG: helix-turn-helix domain-containing protein [Candidatus Moraniibacteriota bacterium]
MSRVRTWLWGQKKLQNYFRALTHELPRQCRNLRLLPPTSQVNHSAYLSSYFQNNIRKNQDRSCSAGASPSPKVPPPGGTFSFPGDNKTILLAEINKIPSRYRAGLVSLIEKYKSSVYLCSIFKPNDFNFGLAEKSDFYCVRRRSWLPVIRELRSIFTRLAARGDKLPNFPEKFTLREKLIMRMLFRFRQRFVKIEEISSYVYGRRMNRNIHSSEVIISGLKQKLSKVTGRNAALNNVRNYGYRVADEVWDEIEKLKVKNE